MFIHYNNMLRKIKLLLDCNSAFLLRRCGRRHRLVQVDERLNTCKYIIKSSCGNSILSCNLIDLFAQEPFPGRRCIFSSLVHNSGYYNFCIPPKLSIVNGAIYCSNASEFWRSTFFTCVHLSFLKALVKTMD